MGKDKALLELAGRPLVAHSVAKLRRVTGNARVLAGGAPGNAALAEFAPLVFDRYPGCGPMGGIEAALADSLHEWNLILPVDVPFLPAAVLTWWVNCHGGGSGVTAAVSLFEEDGLAQPTLLLIRRAVRPFLADAIARGEHKLYPALEEAAWRLAPEGAPMEARVPLVLGVEEHFQRGDAGVAEGGMKPWDELPEVQRRARPLWFANLNTPADFARAQAQAGILGELD